MKKTALTFLLFFIFIFSVSSQNVRYLVKTLSPTEDSNYIKYTGSNILETSGNLNWKEGFIIYHSISTKKPTCVTYNLDEKYDKLLFVLAHKAGGTGANGSGIDIDAKIMVVKADGKKILDKVIFPYDVPERIALDIKGVKELRFEVLSGDAAIAIAEATLWKAGETPFETGNLLNRNPQTVELGKGIAQYFKNSTISEIGTKPLETVRIGGKKYDNGFAVNFFMPLLGDAPGWIYYNLRGQYSKISFTMGPIARTSNSSGSGWLAVKSDKKIIFEEEVFYDSTPKVITLDIEDCKMLSFNTEYQSGSFYYGIVDIKAYPKGTEIKIDTSEESTFDPHLKELPDVCKLLSNIKPTVVTSQTNKQIYDGSSDYITFSMGGTKFSEGIILYEKAGFLDDNISSYAVFDLGREFDYISFTAGYIGKSGVLVNDELRVYADDVLILKEPLLATYPNKEYILPINKCRKLRFENKGSGKLNVSAYGVGDIVLYRGEPVENDLFYRPQPECPNEIDLIDLGLPYIHYVSPMQGNETLYDGSTKRNYFSLGDERIYKGFLLQTSVHFSLDFGIFSDEEEEGDALGAAAIGSAAVGASFVAGGATVGGAVVGSTLAGVAAFLMLAAGGTALETSCAAFNTYGEYNSLTFTVACVRPYNSGMVSDFKETLLIGVDQEVAATLTVYESMEPQTVTVPIKGCKQLMFWLANSNNWSGQFLFYDVKLSKAEAELDIPEDARLSRAVITPMPTIDRGVELEWECPASTRQAEVDSYLSLVSWTYSETKNVLKTINPIYEIETYYLESNAGQQLKAIKLLNSKYVNNSYMSITSEIKDIEHEIEALQKLKEGLINLKTKRISATIGLADVPFMAIKLNKLFKYSTSVIRELTSLINEMYKLKIEESNYLKSILNSAIDIDGKISSEKTIYCPLNKGEVPNSDYLQKVRNF